MKSSSTAPTKMITLLRNADLYSPNPQGVKDILIADQRVAAVSTRGLEVANLPVHEIDLGGAKVVPGFIDNHVHILGGGGGLGFGSRAPELMTSQLFRVGTTTVVGMLGFDANTKSMASLVAKTKTFRQEGLSAYALTGATLEHPVPTLTGRLRDDITFVEEIIGVGEISVSELGYGYDSLGPGIQYIAEAATAAILSGRLAKKAGYLCLQVPPYVGQCLKPLMDMVKKTGLPKAAFVPSHVNQTDEYMADALKWALDGGVVDVGVNYSPENNYERATLPAKAVKSFLDQGVSEDLILMSSDGNGAPPKEEKGEAVPTKVNYMPLASLAKIWRRLIQEEGIELETALKFVTQNPACVLGLANIKGAVAPGFDADLLVLDGDLNVTDVFALGRQVVKDQQVIQHGFFDEIVRKELSNA